MKDTDNPSAREERTPPPPQGLPWYIKAAWLGLLLLLLAQGAFAGAVVLALAVAATLTVLREPGAPVPPSALAETVPAPAAPPPPVHDPLAGVGRMAQALLPVWHGQLQAFCDVLRPNGDDLLMHIAAMHQLQCELQQLLQDQAQPDPQALQRVCQEWGEHGEQALVGLQFMDRLNQMVDVLQQDQQSFLQQQADFSEATAEHVNGWLQALEARYTTEEQRKYHRLSAGASPHANT
ncbi:hypothetical protein ACG0Z6_06305 [Roseateles sp. BYS180W]|uniref:Uncharacterized protein n=1 Tax=Roseateles rivi TaxID=3299028 RepID=A0ABW7FU88_9BURK